MSSPYFFSTGMARSGTNLLSKIISTHSEMHTILGANIEIHRLIRDLLISSSSNEIQNLIPKKSAFSNYFGKSDYFSAMMHVINGNFSLDIKRSEFADYIATSVNRFPYDSPDLKSIFSNLKSNNIRILIEDFLEKAITVRNLQVDIKIGMHESWNIEVLPSLQRIFPQAKFIIMLRDVRGAFSSHKQDTTTSRQFRVNILDYASQYRKYVSLANYFVNNLENFYVIKYENLMISPELEISNLCNFLQVEFEPSMLNPELHIDFSSGKKWQGNSGDGNYVSGFSAARIDKWKKYLSKEEIEIFELVCHLSLINQEFPVKRIPLHFPQSLADFLIDNQIETNRWGSQNYILKENIKAEIAYYNILRDHDFKNCKYFLENFFSPEYFLLD